jgi:phage-related protein
MNQNPSISNYEAAVSAAMQSTYGISWQDACGDVEPLQSALQEGSSPEEFVHWWGKRYDLSPVRGDRTNAASDGASGNPAA